MESHFESSIHSIFTQRSESVAFYRYLDNPKITEDYLRSKFMGNCRKAVSGRRVLVCCDTTDYNLDNHKKRIKDFEGLGWMGDNSKMGFIHQGLLAIDRSDKTTCLGWAGSHFFKRDKQEKNPRSFRYRTRIEGKESYKWIGPSLEAGGLVLNDAEHSLFIMDREADIFEVMARLPLLKNTDVLIRSKQNRRLKTVSGESVLLFDHMGKSVVRGSIRLKIEGDKRRGRKKRDAEFDVRYGKYRIKASNDIVNKSDYPGYIEMYAIEVREKACSVPEGETPICWRLWTSQPVESLEQAVELLECYVARWHIEEAFRLLKTEGFDIESTELESGMKIRKLLLMAMDASIKIIQLKAARSGANEERIENYFEENEIEFMRELNKKLEGNSQKLKNPHDGNSLSYASWVIARMGGWKGYQSQRPPGTITFKKGILRFNQAYIGYLIMKEDILVCKR